MSDHAVSLSTIFEGWDTYQASLVRSIQALSPQQLAWKPASGLRTVGEIASHICEGRVTWFHYMGAPGSNELMIQAAALPSMDAIANDPVELVRWLEASWAMIDKTLRTWTVLDLALTYRHSYLDQTYAVSRQWTIWRIIAHDLHHGGEIALCLGIQGISAPELGDLGGHLNMPALADPI